MRVATRKRAAPETSTASALLLHATGYDVAVNGVLSMSNTTIGGYHSYSYAAAALSEVLPV